MLTLYQIDNEQARLNAMLEETGGELTPEIEQALTLNESNLLVKSQSYVATINQYKALETAAGNEIKRLQDIKKTCENIQTRMKDTLLNAMKTFGREELKTDVYRIGLRKSTQVVIDNPIDIPNEYLKVETSINKTEIAKAIKQGSVVAGAHLEVKQNLNIY